MVFNYRNVTEFEELLRYLVVLSEEKGSWKKSDDGEIRTRAQKTSALNWRLRPLGHIALIAAAEMRKC